MIMHHYQNIKSINAKILCSINSRKMSKIVCLKIIIQIHHMYYFQKEPFLINQKDFDVDYYQLKNYYQILRKFSGNWKVNIIIKNWNFYKFYNFYKYFICVLFFLYLQFTNSRFRCFLPRCIIWFIRKRTLYRSIFIIFNSIMKKKI